LLSQGQTSDERSRNQVELQAYVVDLAGRPMSSWNSRPRSRTGADEAIPDRLTASVESTPESNAKAARLILKDKNGSEVGQAVIAMPSISPISRSATTPTSGQFQLPTLGQQGHPIQIVGPFDGLSTNTTLTWSHVVAPAQDVGRSPDVAAGSLWLMAESPRKSVFESPTNVTGPVELILKEKSAETKGVYRNVGVSLTAPKTELLKGESTRSCRHPQLGLVDGQLEVAGEVHLHAVALAIGDRWQTLQKPVHDLNAGLRSGALHTNCNRVCTTNRKGARRQTGHVKTQNDLRLTLPPPVQHKRSRRPR
jgi:hypothetical protein